MNCPKCGLINPETALRCDCGYEFESGEVKRPYLNTHSIKTLAGRPKWVLVICIFYSLSAVFTLFLQALIYFSVIPLNADQKAYYARFGAMEFVVTVAVELLVLTAVFQLFRLRGNAVVLFVTAFVLSVLHALFQFVALSGTKALRESVSVGVVLGWLIMWAVVVYARRLRGQGVIT